MDKEQRKIDQQIESDIIHTLKSIGFPESLESWQQATPMIDPDGQTLRLLGHPVMERWEEPYMKKLAEIVTSKASRLVAGGGAVLELGFSLGLSAQFIQSCAPKHHVIIEMNRAIAEAARAFAKQQSGRITILEGMAEIVRGWKARRKEFCSMLIRFRKKKWMSSFTHFLNTLTGCWLRAGAGVLLGRSHLVQRRAFSSVA
ncbi:MAG: hypothetical protein U0X75_22805 [Acidobacteriota bacterium]